jgi:hypothetical protein
MVMNEAASAPVVSATRRETPTPLERASVSVSVSSRSYHAHSTTVSTDGVGILPVARGDEAGAGYAVVGRVVPAAHLLEAKHELAELLPSSVHPQRRGCGVVALGSGWAGAAGGAAVWCRFTIVNTQ